MLILKKYIPVGFSPGRAGCFLVDMTIITGYNLFENSIFVDIEVLKLIFDPEIYCSAAEVAELDGTGRLP